MKLFWLVLGALILGSLTSAVGVEICHWFGWPLLPWQSGAILLVSGVIIAKLCDWWYGIVYDTKL